MTGAAARDFDVVLVLSGGNALGAFEAGVYEALHAQGLQPDWVVGASIGAINAALIVGSAPEQRVETLRAFWRPGMVPIAGLPWMTSAMETGRRTAAVGWTAMAGRSGIFGPLLSSMTPWTDDRPSIFETNQLSSTLAQLIDFDLLNAGPCRFTATAVDLQTGEDVVFDSRDRTIGPDHIRASAALPIAFPPVEVDGRWHVDGGLSANLPLDPVLSEPSARLVLCIAVDLLPLGGAVPTTLGEAASRMQDLIFAAQSRRTIARWQAVHAGREDVRIALLRLAYTEQEEEVAGKALDFSPETIERRWAAGHRAGLGAAERVAEGALSIGAVGLNVVGGGEG
ncbi:patatin-like phospholipase family protein [Sphingomonas prati]|uniref:NTE family protein n=1 Tax=Sphingomonas prati TaxID=1843237 RepID=A0A7W9BTE6_9SPHN|nr:patatin-like phospholipase family protein [Sphingomonas prati]MBB5729786.1 NTE family protein [Sphingomonas prati]GGE89538.1 membrane protein [Sphingomonas prati]